MDFSVYGTKVTCFTFMNFVDPTRMAELTQLLLEDQGIPLLICYRDAQFYTLPGDTPEAILSYFEKCIASIQASRTLQAAQLTALQNLAENGQEIH